MLLLWIFLAVLFGAAIVVAKTAAAMYHTSSPIAKKLHETRFSAQSLTSGKVLSVVIPAYNEEERLQPTLQSIFSFCEKYTTSAGAVFTDYEIILVDDCSKDKTKELAKAFGASHPNLKFSVIESKPNHGKGFVVRTGFLHSCGDFVLMADADNATEFADVVKVIETMNKENAMIGVGSRAHLESQAIASRTFGRTVLMKGFHFVVAVTYFITTFGTLCHIHDTQCGFKVFRRKECEGIFFNNRLERWAFDVELLVLARRLGGLKVVEVPVRWEEIPGSKVRFSGMVQMGLECVLMCFAYTMGFWPVRTKQD